MIINVSRNTLDALCECGEAAKPGLFSVQHLGDVTPAAGSMAASGLEPLALCSDCGDEAQAEHGYGVIVIQLI